MDTTRVKAAIANAHKELNTVIDAEWKAKRHQGLRELSLAAKGLELAEKHLDLAVQRVTPKAAAAPAAAATTKTGA